MIAEKPGAHASEVQDYYRRILPFLDLELADRGDAGFWTAAAGAPTGRRVLELGAGSGRATAFLARRASRVVAVDISLDLLAVARRRLAGLPVDLVAADMRHLRLGERFDLVAAVDDPFSHCTRDEDRDRALATAARHLAPEGRFVLDAAWLPPAERRAAACPEGRVCERLHLEPLAGDGGTGGDAGLVVREEWRCDPESRLCDVRFEYRRRGAAVATAGFAARLWSVAELEQRCQAAGLAITALWGDYDRRPWDRRTSTRLIAEARLRS
ncbi:MAG TPA: class I SAM-dependent methyltransferase [Thermoanaerobaculia bacterium]|nr:class I SAM-dependent methyltransferase [Thermoanaerobaculia bacterium]